MGVASYEKYLSKIDKFQTRTVRFGFLKEATLILRAPGRKNQTFIAARVENSIPLIF